jgi:very-short-patch-repair endonuclease
MSEFHPILNDKQLFRGRDLRRDSTFPERRLWACLRAGRLCSLKFRRQFAIGRFTVDFYCHEHRLVIELDGASHDGRSE